MFDGVLDGEFDGVFDGMFDGTVDVCKGSESKGSVLPLGLLPKCHNYLGHNYLSHN